MKKIKYSIIITFLVLLTGCTAEYNVTIEDKTISEELKLTNVDNDYIDLFNKLPSITEENKYYNVKKEKNNLSYSYIYRFDDYKKSNIVKNCYEALQVYQDDNNDEYYILQSGLNFTCNLIQINDYDNIIVNDVKINIKVVGYDVIENNADSVNKNIYTWKINKNNYTNKPIIIKFKVPKNNQSTKNKFNINYEMIAIIIGIIFVAFLIGLGIIKSISNKNNKI